MQRETKLPWWGWMGGLCLLPVLYVLSVFPIAWVLKQLGLEFPDWLNTFYGPLIWAGEEWEWIQDSVVWIAEQMGLP